MKTTMKKLVFAALAALACAVVPSSAAAATGDPCTLRVMLEPGLEAGYVRAAPAQAGQYTAGQTVTLTATATNDFSFVEWVNYNTYETHDESSFSFVITNDVEWTAVFKKNGEYFISVRKPFGDLTVDPLLDSYAPGTNVTLIATPKIGRSIVYETAPYGTPDGSETWTRLSGSTFTMPAHDIWVQALYSINIAASGDEHGTVAISPAGPYYEGDTVTLTMTPDSGYRVKTIHGVPNDTVISGNTATFTLGNYYDLDIHVDFEEIPTVTFQAFVSPPGSGTVAVTRDGATGNYVVTATPTNGYHFLCWINPDDNSILGSDNPYTLHVTDDMSICAVFYVNVVVNPNIEHGSLEVVNSRQTYAAGETVTLLGHPDEGYVVDYYATGEIHNGSATLQPLEGDSFVMQPWDMLVSVAFVRGLTVNAAVSAEGTGTVVGAGLYKPGSTVTLVAEPAEGYTFTGWEENGTIVSTERIYSFTIQTNRNLTANFQSYNGMSFTINAGAIPVAGGTITGTGTYAGGETVTLTAAAAAGYTFLNWTEFGLVVGTNAVHSFTANGNRTLTATFRSDSGVLYTDANGNSSICQYYTVLSSSSTSLSTGWYAAAGYVTIPSRVEIGGNVNLILCDGAVLTVPKGIHLTGSNRLTIWGQSGGTGALVIESPGVDQAGIGGNELQPGGVFTMNGGTLTVTGGQYGAGIGGGGDSHATEQSLNNAGLHTRGWAGSITINGGTVAATGGERGAGIGCGWRGDGGTVTIAGGTVTAVGGTSSAGIGGAESSISFHQSVEEIHVTGGNVTATGSDYAAGIGGGLWGRVGTIIINGGTVAANGGDKGAGIGCGYFGAGGTIIVNDGMVMATGGESGAGIGGGLCVYGNITINGGTVIATGGEQAAGIGGGRNAGESIYKYTGGTVTITGGEVTARAGSNYFAANAAGIGGGSRGPGGDITISGGTVTAIGGYYGSGIGGGSYADCGTVTVTGGTVNASGGMYGAGIGGGTEHAGGTVTVTGGSVTATGGYHAAGIGGGDKGVGGMVAILGGTVRVRAGDSTTIGYQPEAIGHGDSVSGSGGLILGDAEAGIHMRVCWFNVGSREDACRNGFGEVVIEPCVPHGYDRTGYCPYCGDHNGPVLQYAPYVDERGQVQGNVDCQPLTASDVRWDTAVACHGWYAVTESVTIPDRVMVSGSVNLILYDGATLTIPKGIEVAEGNALTIWRQENGTGTLVAGAACDDGDAAIGGGCGKNGGSLTVCSGKVTAIAGMGAQAIGHGAGAAGTGDLILLDTQVFDSAGAAKPVVLAERDAVCRGSWVKIEPCFSHQYEYGVCQLCDRHLAVDYLVPFDGGYQSRTDFSVYFGQTLLTEGWYLLPTDVETSSRVVVSGDVNIILADGATWTASSGVNVGADSSLTLWAQSDGADMGTLIATGGEYAAGIGGGNGEAGGTVTVNGGNVNVIGGVNAAGIGGGRCGDGGVFALRGGTVTSVAGTDAQAIGHGCSADYAGSLVLFMVKVYGSDGAVEPVDAANRETVCRSAWARLARCTQHNFEGNHCQSCDSPVLDRYYDPLDADMPYHICGQYTIYTGQTQLNSGWYVVAADALVGDRIQVNGSVNLLLCDGVELTAPMGIEVCDPNSLTVWAQSESGSTAGKLTAVMNDEYNSGIGAMEREIVGHITINGGIVTAVGGLCAAGIGGGYCGGGGHIVVNGGTVTANGGSYGAGIGSGQDGSYSPCNITITGGTVNASGGSKGAGIGGGYSGSPCTIAISGGTVTAIGANDAAGIGSGYIGLICKVTISGGLVTANGGDHGAGIGGGSGNLKYPGVSGGSITITDGTVTANGGDRGAGIGGGGGYEQQRGGNGGIVKIYGGTVTANGGYCGAGIGGGGNSDDGNGGAGGSVTITGGTVTAFGDTGAAGIGGGNGGAGGNVAVTGGTVTARGGGRSSRAIGRGGGGESNDGELTLGYMRAGIVSDGTVAEWEGVEDRVSICRSRWGETVLLEPCASHQDENADFFCDYCGVYCGPVPPIDANGVFLIGSTDDWNVFAASVAAGKRYADETVQLTADIGITTTVGTNAHPFGGTFDGGGHTLTVNYDDTSRRFLAPFPEISGATIRSLRVEGTVNGKIYCSGLVGRAVGGPNTIRDCFVGASVSVTDGYAGGVVGHGMSCQTTLEGCVFAGSVSGVNVGTLWGWSDNAVAVLENCLDLSDSGFPVGLGGGTVRVINVGYVNPGKTAGSTGAWSEQNRGFLLCLITPGTDVRLAPAGQIQDYDTAGFAACGEAVLLDGILYAGAGRTVGLALEYVGSDDFGVFSASAGTLSDNGGSYALTMPDPGVDVTILVLDKWRYYDPVMGTIVQVSDGAHVYAEGQTTLSGGWHFVTNSVTISDRIIVTGDANLVLCDGAALNAMRGITVAEGARLTIWGQEGQHTVPGTTVKTCGTGTLFAQTYSQAAAIGGEKNGSTGDIVINGGVVTARGVWGAGIGRGDVASGSVGSVTINGGHVDASGNSGSAGIGSGAYGDSCPVTITGGYVLAAGGVYGTQATPGIGTGRPRTDGSQPLSNGTITITGGTVVAQAGTAPSGGTVAQAIGVNAADAAHNGTGHLVLGDVRVYASADAASPVAVSARGDTCRGTYVKVEACASHQDGNADILCDYCGGYLGPVPPIDANGVFLIGSTDDWDVFAASVAAGKRYAGETVQLAANIAVTTTVGTGDHPFGGTFDGGGHTLTVAIDSSNVAAAPFGKIDGATIKNLTVAGTVTGSAYHAAGLVGGCGNDHPNTILNCSVAATVNGSGYAGGIVGHGGEGTLTLDGCVFSGAVNGFDTCAGGLLGWCDALTLTITNCLCTGAFTPAGEGKYHPIACRYASRNVTATVADAYYLNTIVPTVLGVNPTVTTSNLIPGAEGTPVSATLVAGEWAQPVTAADGNEYYGWTTAPAGRLIAHYAFDDTGNGGLNLLHASVGLDAIVRATQTTPVAGIGEIAAVTDAAILSGLSAGDGAVSIPNGQHLAVPVPAALLSAHGRPYTVVMKIRVPNTVGWRSLLNMPALNDTDAMVYLQQTTRNIYLKQFDKSSGAGIAASNGNVAADQWTTLAFAFGESTTDVYRDGTHVLHAEGALANSYADCAAAGGYILVGADDSGDDDLFYLSDFRIYEGAIAVTGILPGSGSSRDPYIITSSADWDTFAANVNAGATSAACYRLCADIAITTTVGTSDHPFGGTFDGGGHTLTANLSGTDSFVAPFSAISGATISNLMVAGTVAGYMHCSGLVGAIVHGVNVIENCEVAAAITSSGSHFGGFIGHSITSTVTLRGCVFSGRLAGGTYVATFHGWSDDGAVTTLIDCLDVSESTQPIGRGCDAVCVSNTYYLASKSFTNGERLWSEGKRGKRASVIAVDEGVTLAIGAPIAVYGTSGVTAYAMGLAFDGNFYTVSGYVIWAVTNGVTGAWNAADASGIPNVFRYAFDKPTGDFALLGISFNGDGKVVIVTPPLVNGEGVALSIVASDNVDGGGGVATTPLDPSGETVINETGKKKRFFRLRATKQ